jgi:hypothetical protein
VILAFRIVGAVRKTLEQVDKYSAKPYLVAVGAVGGMALAKGREEGVRRPRM